MSRRKGRRLAVSLPPEWPRWGSLAIGTIAIGAYVAAFLGFSYFGGEEFAPHRMVIVAVLCGGIVLVVLPFWVRDLILWTTAGDRAVEISHEPVALGDAVEYYIVQGRDHSTIRKFEASLLCRRRKHRHPVEVLAEVALAPAEIEPGGRRGVIQGRLNVPEGPPTSPPGDPIFVQWEIELRVTFGRRTVLKECHPLKVAAPDKKEPPSGA